MTSGQAAAVPDDAGRAGAATAGSGQPAVAVGKGPLDDDLRTLLVAPGTAIGHWLEREAELWKAGRLAQATSLSRCLVCLEPGDFNILSTCGARLAKTAATRDATWLFEIAFRLRVDRKIAGRLADCYAAAGRWADAIAVLRAAASALRHVPQLRVQLAAMLAEHGTPDEARVELRAAAAMAPDPGAAAVLVRAAMRLGAPEETVGIWRAAGSPASDAVPGFLPELGIELARAGELLAAAACLDRASRRDRQELLVGLWLAWVRRRLTWNDDGSAVAYEGQAFDLARRDDYELLGRAIVRHQHAALARSLTGALREQVRLAPDEAEGCLRLGLLHHGLLEPQHAVQLLAEAVRLAPDDAACVIAHARALELDRRRPEAIAALEVAAMRLPRSAAIIEECANIQARAGLPAQALELARRGASAFPDHLPFHAAIAALAQEQGGYAEASGALQKLFQLRPATLAETDDLALMLMTLGRREEAAAALAQGIATTGRRQSADLPGILADAARRREAGGDPEEDAARLRRTLRELRVDHHDFRRLGMQLYLGKADEEGDRAAGVLRDALDRAPADTTALVSLFYFLFGLNRISDALNLWLDSLRPLCGAGEVLPEHAFQRPPQLTVTPVAAGWTRPQEPTFGLVIQGPVTHRGFDGRDNIRRLVDDFGRRFKVVVVSTWEGEADPGLEAANCHVLFTRDTTPTMSRDGIPLRNRVRQMLSTQAGIDHIRGLGGTDYVIKIRTDLHADLAVLCDHMLDCERRFSEFEAVGQKNFIFTPTMQVDGPYLTGDIMLAGHIDDLENFLLATLETQEDVFRPYKSLPESDMILKHLYRNLRPVLRVPDYLNFPIIRKNKPPVPYPKGLMQYWAQVVRYSLAPMPRRLFETAVFRGGKLPMNFLSNRRIDFERWTDMRADWFGYASALVPDMYDADAEAFDHVYFCYIEKAVEMAGVALPAELRRCLVDYRSFVDRTKSPVRG